MLTRRRAFRFRRRDSERRFRVWESHRTAGLSASLALNKPETDPSDGFWFRSPASDLLTLEPVTSTAVEFS